MRIHVDHPYAGALAGAPGFAQRLFNGEWGAIADLCAGQLTDATAARAELNALSVGARAVEPFPQIDSTLTGTGVCFQARAVPEVVAALDVFQCALAGQWSALVHTCGLGSAEPLPASLGVAVAAVRDRWQADVGFPHGAWRCGVPASAELLAMRVAYGAWRSLGAGVASRPYPDVAGAPVIVRIEA